jgi:hypothetical protein
VKKSKTIKETEKLTLNFTEMVHLTRLKKKQEVSKKAGKRTKEK